MTLYERQLGFFSLFLYSVFKHGGGHEPRDVLYSKPRSDAKNDYFDLNLPATSNFLCKNYIPYALYRLIFIL